MNKILATLLALGLVVGFSGPTVAQTETINPRLEASVTTPLEWLPEVGNLVEEILDGQPANVGSTSKTLLDDNWLQSFQEPFEDLSAWSHHDQAVDLKE